MHTLSRNNALRVVQELIDRPDIVDVQPIAEATPE
jgi:hypothetical protein